jgi:hypothetical protein
MSSNETDKVRIQVGNEVWETDIWGLPLMAEAILRSTEDEVKLDIDERDLLEASDNAAV